MSRARRVYVASKFNNYAEVRKAQADLRLLGCEISYDWTRHVDEGEPNEPECAEKDMQGVLTADALLLIAVPEMRGAYVEMGMALAKGIPIHIFTPNPEAVPHHIFNKHLSVTHHQSMEAAILAVAAPKVICPCARCGKSCSDSLTAYICDDCINLPRSK